MNADLHLAVLAYSNALRVQSWVGNVALLIERELFGRESLQAVYGDHAGKTFEDRLKRLGEQLLPLQDRASRMMARNLKALEDLKKGPALTVSVGKADQVNVANNQVNTAS